MGGYAVYVWTAFGLAFLILVGNVVAARRKLKGAERAVAAWLRRERGARAT